MGQGMVVPITVRQLEALVRLSESLAKMQLRNDVSEEHVREAIRLFKASTMDAVRSGLVEGLSFTAEQVDLLVFVFLLYIPPKCCMCFYCRFYSLCYGRIEFVSLISDCLIHVPLLSERRTSCYRKPDQAENGHQFIYIRKKAG